MNWKCWTNESVQTKNNVVITYTLLSKKRGELASTQNENCSVFMDQSKEASELLKPITGYQD